MMVNTLPRLVAFLLLPMAIIHPSTASAQGQDVKDLAAAYNASGQMLYRRFAGKPGNIVFSPYSIGAAMAMARAGARGETERQMAAVLQHGKSSEKIDAANAALLAHLNAYDRTQQPGYCPQEARWTGVRCEAPLPASRRCPFAMGPDGELCVGQPLRPAAKLTTANALMLAKYGSLIASAYRDRVSSKYAAEILEATGVDEVNAWVGRKTEGKIDRILDRLDRDAAAVLLNAIYFKAAWASTFDKASTRDDDFRLSAARTVRVSMMRQRETMPLVERTGYRAIRLGYTEEALGMIIVLPEKVEGLAGLERQLDANELTSLLSALKSAPTTLVALALPRFKTAFGVELVEPLRQAGMTLPFTDDADFSGMTEKEPARGGVKINTIEHRALIDVTEHGTEAAAATAVGLAKAAGMRKEPTPVPFIVDHPFLFFVADDASGAILFQGRIVNPLPE